MPTLNHNRLLTAAATAVPLLVISAMSAAATDDQWRYVEHGTSQDVGATPFEGFSVTPLLTYDTLKFDGAAGGLLKDAKGVQVGLQGAYDVQFSGIVVGMIGEISWSDIEGKGRSSDPLQLRSSLEYFGNVRARLGYAFDRFLVYGTGGYAFAELGIESKGFGVKDDVRLNGWIAGGGIEYAWNEYFSIRAEYTHTEFEEKDFSALPAGRSEVEASLEQIRFDFVTRW